MDIFNIFKKKSKVDIQKEYISTWISSDRTRRDILEIREAVKSAEVADPKYRNRSLLQNIYNDSINDGHLLACIESRKNLTLKKDFLINDNEDLTELFKQKWFYDSLSILLDSVFFGYSLLTYSGIKDNKLTGVKTIRRDCINVDTEQIQKYSGDTDGKSINDEDISKWCLLAKTTNNLGYTDSGLGLLLPCSVYALAIRNNLGFNIDFVEKFIIPFVVARTMKHEGEERDALEAGIANMASSNSVVLDPNDDIQFIESKNAGSGYNSFDNLENRCEKKISKIILGHADAIDSTSGKLGSNQNEAVEKALKAIEETDTLYLESIINDEFLPRLFAIGFPIPQGSRIKFLNSNEKHEQLEKESTVNKLFVDVVKTLFDSGLNVDPKFITEKTGIPVKKTLQPTNINPKELNNLYGL